MLQDKSLKQLHFSPMGIEKAGILACKSIDWINMNAYRGKMVNVAQPAWTFKEHKEKIGQCHVKY